MALILGAERGPTHVLFTIGCVAIGQIATIGVAKPTVVAVFPAINAKHRR